MSTDFILVLFINYCVISIQATVNLLLPPPVFIQVEEHVLFNNLSASFIPLKYNGKRMCGPAFVHLLGAPTPLSPMPPCFCPPCTSLSEAAFMKCTFPASPPAQNSPWIPKFCPVHYRTPPMSGMVPRVSHSCLLQTTSALRFRKLLTVAGEEVTVPGFRPGLPGPQVVSFASHTCPQPIVPAFSSNCSPNAGVANTVVCRGQWSDASK